MAEIEFLLLDQAAGQISSGKAPGRHRMKARLPVCQEENWHGFSLRLHRVNAAWTESPRRIQDYVEKQKENGVQLWTDRGLDSFLKEHHQPLPSPQLACFLLKNQPFRQQMLFYRGQLPWEYGRFWQEKFLENSYQDLNGLYLLGDGDVDNSFLEQIYGDSGLLAVCVDRMPEAEGRKCVFVDLAGADFGELRGLPEGCLYLDLRSDKEKQRYFALKRTDISYTSARNYLDIAMKARYNAV